MRRKPSPLEWLVLLATAGVSAALRLPGPDYDSAHRYPPAAVYPGEGFEAVAGEYRRGAHRGKSLSVSILPDGRYSFVWSTCVGVARRESGHARHADGLIVLSPSGPNSSGVKRAFLPIRWDRRAYLVRPVDLGAFRKSIVLGEEPRVGSPGRFYLRVPAGRAEGVPELPPEWAKSLHDTLILGRVVEVQGRSLKIDVGAADGVRADDVLTAPGPDDFDRLRLAVVAVGGHSCTAVDVNGGAPGPSAVGRRVVGARSAMKP